MHAPWTIAILMLGSQLVSASINADSSCGSCQVGYSCQAGTCVLDTARLTGNPLPNITSDNPGGPIKTTGISATTEVTSTGEAKTTGTATGDMTSSNGETKSTSKTEAHSSSSPSMTSQASSSSLASSSSAGAAASTSSGAASSLSLEGNSWVAWGLAWAIGLPLVA
ncbi:uncharacterized protein N7473_012470 [Penicillium subrubescens]|jgi:hypothetical protein|uniref:Uncharacterized protein n=1 Tax=Penicillium subrubescens TaxID=1316194 RepID=A0A1Q5SRI1_9EURO|nr:uncharacterized protein N7473_012470 [Penicillium subrubescens]KAJ5875123.1 hypothetical protein N7473_012470 [Penicillium subrubescens]OKO90617.1 hypothetical protein PENSUB_13334 [Penicillium subrubescens]